MWAYEERPTKNTARNEMALLPLVHGRMISRKEIAVHLFAGRFFVCRLPSLAVHTVVIIQFFTSLRHAIKRSLSPEKDRERIFYGIFKALSH
jgi:hypothetical protein